MSDQVFLGAAVRFDDHQRFDNETTYRLTVAWAVPETGLKLRGSYGVGAAQPSFFELFGFNPNFFIGNPNLKPETSEGWDAGVDYAFENGQGLASLTYFDSNLKSEIFTDFTVFPFTVKNRGGTSTRDGVEASLRYLPLDSVQLSASYTYTDAKDDNGSRELRRPRHTGSVNATYRFLEDRATIDFGLNYNGTMHDSEFIFATPETVVTLDDYILGTVAASYALSDAVELIGRVENLFDENYQDVFGFASPGIGFYLGVRVGFRGQ
jgi:vitamin B12 transporter